MKILRIRGRNLASLADTFEIDLLAAPLGGKGVFALSGPTGAGKSSILDALCLALYASTPRLERASRIQIPDPSGQELSSDATVQLLRRGTASGFAEVEFVGIDARIYRARYSLRRANESPSGRFRPALHELFAGDDARPCGGNNTETKAAIIEKLGLDFRQFTRAVLLAQNEFATFLAAENDERAALLERLTGTERFGLLSIRAFERARSERQRLETLDAELGATPILDEAALRALEDSIVELTANLLAVEAQVAALDAGIGFLERREQLQSDIHRAECELIERIAQSNHLLTERAEVQRIRRVIDQAKDLVQATERARQDRQRLESEVAVAAQQCEAAEQAVYAEREFARRCEQSLEDLRQRHEQLLPKLRQALLLDQDLTREHEARNKCQEELKLAEEKSLQAKAEWRHAQERLEAQAQQLREVDEWLTQHATLAQVSEDWPRKQLALTRAVQRINALEAQRTTIGELERRHGDGAEQLKRLGDAIERQRDVQRKLMADAEAKRQLLQQDDLELLENSERDAERRLEQHDQLIRLAREHAACQQQLALLETRQRGEQREVTHLSARVVQYQSRIEAARVRLHETLLEQQTAERTCSETVVALRAVLERGCPCPVCGATQHPFGDDLTEEVAGRLRKRLQDLGDAFASLQVELTVLEKEQSATQSELARWQGQLTASGQTLVETQERCLRLQEELRLVEAQASPVALTTADRLTNQSERRRELEQEFDVAQQLRAQAKQRRFAAEQAERQARSGAVALERVEGELGQVRESVARIASELDACRSTWLRSETEQLSDFRGIGIDLDSDQLGGRAGVGWQDHPAAFAAALSREVAEWQRQSTCRHELELACIESRAKHAECERRQKELIAALRSVEDQLAALTRRSEELSNTRRTICAGRPVGEVEAEMQAQLQQALNQLDAARARCQLAERDQSARHADTETRRGLLDQTQTLHRALDAELDQWLGQFNQVEQSVAAITRQDLPRLIESGPAFVAEAEQRLAASEASIEQARGALEQSKQAYDAHEISRRATIEALDMTLGDSTELDVETPPLQLDVTTLKQRRVELAQQREAIRERRAEAFVARQRDEQQRTLTQQRREQRLRQYAVTERWSLLSSLIGSADGKKLRLLAQEVTLDLVLAHANHHLRDLARRYRLERLTESLNVIIVDQAMLGEPRSVASLSGGETFLVSLALALGLASLSAEKVRVETLFIDEGFGSLDSQTLQTAVAALESVQAQGRQVGLVSHVGELADRLGVEVRVEPQGNGKSRVRVLGHQRG